MITLSQRLKRIEALKAILANDQAAHLQAVLMATRSQPHPDYNEIKVEFHAESTINCALGYEVYSRAYLGNIEYTMSYHNGKIEHQLDNNGNGINAKQVFETMDADLEELEQSFYNWATLTIATLEWQKLAI